MDRKPLASKDVVNIVYQILKIYESDFDNQALLMYFKLLNDNFQVIFLCVVEFDDDSVLLCVNINIDNYWL